MSSFSASELLKAVQCNSTNSIQKYLGDDPHLLEHEYVSHDKEKIFIIACNDQYSMEKVEGTTLETLINSSQCTKYSEPSQNDKWDPIHYTALNANFEKMKAIVKNLESKNVNSLVYCCKEIVQKYQTNSCEDHPESYSNNALHILFKYAKRSDTFYDCCKLLIEKGININQADSNGMTALDLMEEVDKNRLQISPKAAEERIDLFNLLSKVQDEKEANGYDGSEDSVSSCTLVQLCCAKGLTAEVEQLIKKGAECGKTCTKNPKLPIMIAIEADNEDIVALLLKDLPKDILLKVQKTANSTISEKYLKIVLTHLSQEDKTICRQYLQETDDEKRTILHYTVLEDFHEVTQMLISMGASVIVKDVFGISPLDSIDNRCYGKVKKSMTDCDISSEEETESNTLSAEFRVIKDDVNWPTVSGQNLQ
jgi:ankyrin repeat protein